MARAILNSALSLFARITKPRELRQELGMNQTEFWNTVGATQSAGSRYEAGREMPVQTQAMVKLVHVHKIDISNLQDEQLHALRLMQQGAISASAVLEMADTTHSKKEEA